MLRHLPNLLSGLRLLAAPVAAFMIVSGYDTAALLVFAAAGASDGLDGFIARRWGFTSQFGAWLDPAADKLLMLLCFIALTRTGMAPLWLTVLVVARDAAIAGGWLLARIFALPVRFEPLAIGKASTVVQVVYIFVLLLLLALDWQSPGLVQAASLIAAVLTLASGLAYVQVFLRGVHPGGRVA